jgi:hypothetical protein
MERQFRPPRSRRNRSGASSPALRAHNQSRHFDCLQLPPDRQDTESEGEGSSLQMIQSLCLPPCFHFKICFALIKVPSRHGPLRSLRVGSATFDARPSSVAREVVG